MPVILVELYATIILIFRIFEEHGWVMKIADAILLVVCVIALVHSFTYARRHGLRALTKFYWDDFLIKKGRRP